MTNFDRYLIDIDKFFNSVSKQTGNYPPFNSYSYVDGDAYLEFALAGWDESELSITIQDGSNLVIQGKKESQPERGNKTMHHNGISQRNFTTKFVLQSGSEVTETSFVNGLLRIKIEKKTASADKIPLNFKQKHYLKEEMDAIERSL